MSLYEELVTQTQMNYQRYYGLYASGRIPYELTDKKPQSYKEQISRLVQEIRDADCVVVGGASGLSAAGGGDFYYEDNASYRKYFGKYAEKYGFKGAFDGMFRQWDDRAEFWGYLATFLQDVYKRQVEAADRKRFEFVNSIVKDVEKRTVFTKDKNFQDKIDAVITHKVIGIPIFAVVMYLVFYISQSTVGTWIADWLVGYIETFQGYVGEVLLADANPFLVALLADGIVAVSYTHLGRSILQGEYITPRTWI